MCTEIIERFVTISEDPDTVNLLFPLLSVKDYQYAYCLYAKPEKGPPQLISGYLTTSLEETQGTGEMNDFRAFMDMASPKSFTDFLFLLDFYQTRQTFCGLSPRDLCDLINTRFPFVPIVDDLLQSSKGFLLWHYQLECLFRCFFDDLILVVQYRKKINKREAEIFELAGSLTFGEKTLEEVVRERMVRGHTSFPNVMGAELLFRLRECKQKSTRRSYP